MTTATKPLTRAQILSQSKQAAKNMIPVPVEEWGGTFYVKSMSSGQFEQWETSLHGEDGQKQIKPGFLRASVVVATVCNKNGVPLFKATDVPELADSPAGPINKLFEVAARVNALTQSDVDELVGNSGKTGDASS